MDERLQQRIGRNLQAARKQAGLTQVELATKAGIDDNYYAKIERGQAVPSLSTFLNILKVLKVTANDIIER